MLASMTPAELAQEALLLAAIFALPSWIFSFILHFFIALKSTPARRAAWTVAPAFVMSCAVAVLWTPDLGLVGIGAAVPGAILAYFYWLWLFRRAWVDDTIAGVALANDDWRRGLACVGLVLLALAARVAWRLLMRAP